MITNQKSVIRTVFVCICYVISYALVCVCVCVFVRAPVIRPRHATVSRPSDDRQPNAQGGHGLGKLDQIHKI